MFRSGIGAGPRFAMALGSAGLAWGTAWHPAHAQFVCLSTDGTGQGADASGNPTNFACGPGANASGSDGFNNASGFCRQRFRQQQQQQRQRFCGQRFRQTQGQQRQPASC